MATSQALDVQLAIKDVKEVCRELNRAKNKWFNLGVVLNVSDETLSTIEDTLRGDHDICLKEVLYHRLQSKTPLTWRILCQSLRDTSVGYNDLADEISKQKGEFPVVSMDDQSLATELTPKHLHQVFTRLKKASMNWLQMGYCLNVSHDTLASIRDHHRDSTNGCLYEMLAQRLKLHPALTWLDLCQCLRNPNVKRNDLATAIEMELKSHASQYIDQKLREDLYLDAIKKGCVIVKTCNVLLFGMAGTGKTSTKHLILGLPPPLTRSSTSVAEAAKRVQIREIRDLSGMIIQEIKRKWQLVTADNIKKLVVDIINSHIKRISVPSGSASQMSKEFKTKSLIDSSSVDSGLSSQGSVLSESELTETENYPDLFLKQVSDVIKDIQSKVGTQSYESEEVIGSNWIYFIDSGGQPHFHNLLPLFVRGISAALYVLRLSDKLDDHPMVEYYKDGKQVGKPFKSYLTTEDNFKYLVQSIQSSRHNKDCNLICIGTHLDKIDECSETIEEKHDHLLGLLPNCIIENCHFDKGSIFAINACTEVLTDRETAASKLRGAIEKCPFKEIKIPVWWYILELILKKISSEENQKVFSIKQCKVVARELQLDEVDINGALQFFHDHHIFHYYPNVLPDVVFCDTQVLLDKVTELVEYAAYLKDDTNLEQGSMFQVRNRGIITLEFLEGFTKHYVDGLFGPAELVQILEHLLIATRFNSSPEKLEYFMPSLLGKHTTVEIEKLRKKVLQNSAQLIIQFRSGWPPCGVFCCIQVYLIKECGWSVGKHFTKNNLKQNAVKYYLPDEPYNVTLIDSITYIEVYVVPSSPKISVTPRVCDLVKSSMRSGIQSACETLHYDNEETELAFLCPHTPSETECEPSSSKKMKIDNHPAIILGKSGFMRCTSNDDDCYPLEDQHKMWIDHEIEKGSKVISTDVYQKLIECTTKLTSTMSSAPESLATRLFQAGLISQQLFSEITELNKTKEQKGTDLFRAVLNTVKAFPNKFDTFVKILKDEGQLYEDVLACLDIAK